MTNKTSSLKIISIDVRNDLWEEFFMSEKMLVTQALDTVYLLGDICFRIGVEKANELIASLKGKKYPIRGNHDNKYD